MACQQLTHAANQIGQAAALRCITCAKMQAVSHHACSKSWRSFMGQPPWHAYIFLNSRPVDYLHREAHHAPKCVIQSCIIFYIHSHHFMENTIVDIILLLFLLFLFLFLICVHVPIPILIPIPVPVLIPVSVPIPLLVLVQAFILVTVPCTGEQAAGRECKTAVRAGSSAC